MKKLLFVSLLLMISMIFAVATNSSFLGDKERGIGVEVTRGGDVNITPKSTVGRTTFSNPVSFTSDILVNDVSYDDMAAAIDSLRNYLADGLLVDGTLAISAGPTSDFKTTTQATYTISGITYTKSAWDSLSFTAAYTINVGDSTGSYFGIFLIQINAAGTISTLAPAADQSYTSAALAIAALPSPAASNVSLGYILVNATEDGHWTANTDDMTDGSDCETAVFVDTAIKVLPGVLP